MDGLRSRARAPRSAPARRLCWLPPGAERSPTQPGTLGRSTCAAATSDSPLKPVPPPLSLLPALRVGRGRGRLRQAGGRREGRWPAALRASAPQPASPAEERQPQGALVGSISADRLPFGFGSGAERPAGLRDQVGSTSSSLRPVFENGMLLLPTSEPRRSLSRPAGWLAGFELFLA